ncbi:amidophosphoribosyltransferase [Marivirga tractuosa]|uniref:Amidophosphoribosyltransferase n=1 Tax=Marivirga tractuosa (strain ATCC 23168 / DSM 4126 / NBRC 15989 / NCIMB 1408 / VKM B-1430 / H-43) TaxID=643867 RepID=E4TPH1_MARTH|nr:amidophosphoribosyltransferase [Marivirga tractuosa]ADR21559.1 Amidophosphoribosyltransferase [Marivirga tractuosa DSM 4126]BDD13986.1 amidophosphoribosyltransferase [Marivirga tractuosa]
MSDIIKHECGIALIRLRKPLQYFIDKYGPLYAMNKLYLLMEKQHNRGQDGAGVGNVKLNVDPGHRYISRYRSVDNQPITQIFKKISKKYKKAKKEGGKWFNQEKWLKENCAFTGEVWLGHLRYGTHGQNAIENCHPMLRQNNWKNRSLMVAGNFNMTNVEELFDILTELGQHPKEKVDTVTVMEKIGHFLDEENQRIFEAHKDEYTNAEITQIIEEKLDLLDVLQRACRDFDGGYAMAGITGAGHAFVARDPSGIRPAHYYADDEVVVVASEKTAIKTAFNVNYADIQEIKPAHALVINTNGDYKMEQFIEPLERKSCSFERIYFSRGSDPAIYAERKMLGKLLVPKILDAIDYDLENTVFSYIPNTAETSFLGMMEGMEQHLAKRQLQELRSAREDDQALEKLLSFRPRVEKLVIKDAKLRTFITDDAHRDDLVAHVYDTTYEVIKKKVDTVVVIDDSIVRGTTLEKSILRMLDRLEPKKIIIVSSAPQIRFPDCYGIDMSKMKDFIAFRAVLALLEETKQENILEEAYQKCLNSDNTKNHVKDVFAPFTYEQISQKIAELVKIDTIEAEVEVIYQTVENLHKASPEHTGDWYFTGDFPTQGGNRVVNKAFVNFMEGKEVRAY